jgi:Domain of unknown function (DUF4249)
MSRHSTLRLTILFGVLFYAGCIEEITFEAPDADQDQMVVNGVFTDEDGPHQLVLTRPGKYNEKKVRTITGAAVILTDDAGNRYTYKEEKDNNQNSTYVLKGVKGVPGRTYTLEINAGSSGSYRSRPQKMLPPIPIDSIEVTGDWLFFTSANGIVVQQSFGFAYARARVPEQAEGRYLHWDASIVYIFNEVPNPFKPNTQCFVNEYIGGQLISVADPSAFQPGTRIRVLAGRKRVNYAFEHRVCFVVQQRTIDRAAYDYWRKLEKIITPNGTIFDVPPSPLPGNLEPTDPRYKQTLGYFEVASVQTKRFYTQNGGLGDLHIIREPPYCEYFPYEKPECGNCLLIAGSSNDKPDWWQ